MEIRISVVNGDVADLESLSDWLRGERELAGRVKLTGPPPQAGELGALTETLVVAVGSGGAITVVGAALAGSLKAWLSQPRRSDVTLKIQRSDGTLVELTAKRVKAGDIDIVDIIGHGLGSGDPHALTPGTAEE